MRPTNYPGRLNWSLDDLRRWYELARVIIVATLSVVALGVGIVALYRRDWRFFGERWFAVLEFVLVVLVVVSVALRRRS